jgi:hypothetical protein
MEPLRPFCDLMLFNFHKDNPRKPITEYIKYVAKELIDLRIKEATGKSFKLFYSIDRYVSAIADCFYTGWPGTIFIPKIKDIYFDGKN